MCRSLSERLIKPYLKVIQGVHQILCFFEDLKIYSGLWPLSVLPRRQCVYTMAGQTPALQQNWQSSEKNKKISGKNTIFNEHPVTDHIERI